MSFHQVIYANVSTKDKPPAPLDDVDTPFKIKFTYGAKWIQTECVQFFLISFWTIVYSFLLLKMT